MYRLPSGHWKTPYLQKRIANTLKTKGCSCSCAKQLWGRLVDAVVEESACRHLNLFMRLQPTRRLCGAHSCYCVSNSLLHTHASPCCFMSLQLETGKFGTQISSVGVASQHITASRLCTWNHWPTSLCPELSKGQLRSTSEDEATQCLSGGPVVFKDASDHGAIWKPRKDAVRTADCAPQAASSQPVTSRADNFAIVPEAFKLSSWL